MEAGETEVPNEEVNYPRPQSREAAETRMKQSCLASEPTVLSMKGF